MSKSKAIGTAAESAIVKYARLNGFGNAERRALAGNDDLGDVLMCPGFIIEAKAGKTAEALQAAELSKWHEELRTEQANYASAFGLSAAKGFLVTKRRGYGPERAGFWWAHFSSAEWFGHGVDFTLTTTLAQALILARLDGYGDPLTSGVTL